VKSKKRRRRGKERESREMPHEDCKKEPQKIGEIGAKSAEKKRRKMRR
jgi:hypothetical protein